MSKYNPEKFNFSKMKERITFQVLNDDGTYSDNTTVWAHVSKDGFTRSESDNWFKIMMREHTALFSLLNIGNRLKWKNTTLSIFSWQDPSYESKRFIEIMGKQIVTGVGSIPGPTDGEFFRDVVSVYSMNKIEVNQYGIISYKYDYDFDVPSYVGIRCYFSSDRNRFLDDKNIDTEHDSMIVKFSIDAPVKVEDYIISPIHGKFKVDMVVKDENNMLLAYAQRSEVQ
jgi:hypothetical protein